MAHVRHADISFRSTYEGLNSGSYPNSTQRVLLQVGVQSSSLEGKGDLEFCDFPNISRKVRLLKGAVQRTGHLGRKGRYLSQSWLEFPVARAQSFKMLLIGNYDMWISAETAVAVLLDARQM